MEPYAPCLLVVILFGILLAVCHPKIDTMAEAEKIFVKMVDKTSGKLELNQGQKILLEKLKLNIREEFLRSRDREEGRHVENQRGKREGEPEYSDDDLPSPGILSGETQRMNRAFDLMLSLQKNLNDGQKKKSSKMISEWVAKWD